MNTVKAMNSVPELMTGKPFVEKEQNDELVVF
jgi:hypothetical protein